MYVVVYYQRTDYGGDLPPCGVEESLFYDFQAAYDSGMANCPDTYAGHDVSFEVLKLGGLPW